MRDSTHLYVHLTDLHCPLLIDYSPPPLLYSAVAFVAAKVVFASYVMDVAYPYAVARYPIPMGALCLENFKTIGERMRNSIAQLAAISKRWCSR